MFRPTALRPLNRSVPHCKLPIARLVWRDATFKARLTSQATSIKTSNRLSLAIRKPFATSIVRYQSTINKAAEEEYRKQTLQADPEAVSVESSVRHLTREEGVDNPEPDVDMMAGVKSDFVSGHCCQQSTRS